MPNIGGAEQVDIVRGTVSTVCLRIDIKASVEANRTPALVMDKCVSTTMCDG